MWNYKFTPTFLERDGKDRPSGRLPEAGRERRLDSTIPYFVREGLGLCTEG